MSNKGKWLFKASVLLFLSVVVTSPAVEVVEGGFHVDGLGGRSYGNGGLGSNNLNVLSNPCGAGRSQGAGFNGLGSAVAPGVQGGAAVGGGVVQASVPPGAVIPPSASNSAGAQLFQSKCLSCHETNGKTITAGKAVTKLNGGLMPPPPAKITADEKAQLLSYVQSGALN